jgi:hypothetical protein
VEADLLSGGPAAQQTVGLGGIDGAPEALDLHPLSPQRVEIQGKSYDHPRHLQPPLLTNPRELIVVFWLWLSYNEASRAGWSAWETT